MPVGCILSASFRPYRSIFTTHATINRKTNCRAPLEEYLVSLHAFLLLSHRYAFPSTPALESQSIMLTFYHPSVSIHGYLSRYCEPLKFIVVE